MRFWPFRRRPKVDIDQLIAANRAKVREGMEQMDEQLRERTARRRQLAEKCRADGAAIESSSKLPRLEVAEFRKRA